MVSLNQVDLEIAQGSFTVILGCSGSGKSTLLSLMAGLDQPSSGRLVVDGLDLTSLNSSRLAKYRSAVGIIFQFYNLLPNLNTIENILMDEWVGGGWPTEAEAIELSEKFNLKPGQKANARTLSGGEKQRVAICRALLGKPKILFCDEPTGALDSQNEEQVKQILVDLNKAGMTVVMVTHNQLFAEIAIQIVSMQDGSIVDNKPNRKDLKIVNRKQL